MPASTIFGQRMPAFEEAQAGSTAHLMNAPRDASRAQEEVLLTDVVRNAHALYESNTEEKARVTQDALTDTLPHKPRRWGALGGGGSGSSAVLDDDVLASDVLMYTPSTASMSSGVQFMPHSNVGANALEQAVVDRTSAEDMLQAQYSRVVLPTNGTIAYTNAVSNNIIAEAATRSILTKYRGRENQQINQELHYHPLGYYSEKPNDDSVWAYRKKDLHWGIAEGAVVTSNIEHLPQAHLTAALTQSRQGANSIQAALDDMYAAGTAVAPDGPFDVSLPAANDLLGSQNPLPLSTGDVHDEYTDIVPENMAATEALLEQTRSLNGTSGDYAPVAEKWFTDQHNQTTPVE